MRDCTHMCMVGGGYSQAPGLAAAALALRRAAGSFVPFSAPLRCSPARPASRRCSPTLHSLCWSGTWPTSRHTGQARLPAAAAACSWPCPPPLTKDQLLPSHACRDVVKTVDLRNPHQWFPVARALQRR
jgi:hypothetical protein